MSESIQTTTGQTVTWERAEFINRLFARAIDSILFGALTTLFYPFGVLAAFVYVLIADGLWDGRSVGKRILGLRVRTEPEDGPARVSQSVVRNLPLAFVWFLALIPLLGWFFLFTVGLAVLGLECYLVVTEKKGRRAGDILAKTRVVSDYRASQP